ncbi:MAG: hypothetical protein HGJ94_05195 [Desulfosarcina sp.]|nr:hypothetical protein [Desulfosarcina sp.]
MMIWVALGLTAETAIFMLAGFAWFRSMEYTIAEAAAGAVVSVFMALSLIHQLSLFIGSPLPGFILEPAALAAVLFFGIRRLPHLFQTLASAARQVRQETFPGLAIAAAWTVMAGLVGMGWFSTDHLLAVHPWNELMAGSATSGLVRLAGADPIPPLNATALFYHTARFGLGPNACGFGLLAHMAVGFSTYALARRYAWPSMALTVTLMVLSMPRLVFLGLWPSAELVSTAAIAFSLVLIYRLVEQHQSGDLRFFVLCILFSIYANPMSIALAPVMVLLLMVIMIRRHGWLLWRELIAAKPLLTALALLPALGLAQIPVFACNLANGHPLFGAAVDFDNDGILGAAANIIRFLFISFDPTEPVQKMLVWLVGLDLNRLMMGVYNTLVVPVFGHAGVHGPFIPIFSGSGRMGFGPFALMLVLPAMIHALVRGPRRLKAVGVAWVGYLYLAALVVAWHPDSLSILCPLYAANGFIVAFSLPPWRLRRRGMRILQVVFALLMAWSLACGWWMPV